jgi:hypothetical protein
MRVAACFAAVIVLSACEKEKSFDERYANAAEVIVNEAQTIDRGLENQSEDAGREGPAGEHAGGASNSQN